MPELPEVETTRLGLAPHLEGRAVSAVVVRESRLRWPVPDTLSAELTGKVVRNVQRRGKYLLLRADNGTAILHLGMSGSLRIIPADTIPEKHDHVDLVLDSGLALRLNDPRRFGAILWTRDEPADHWLLTNLGPEPLDDEFDGDYLSRRLKGRRAAIKTSLMNSRIVAGIGNIYASESLYLAGIHPKRSAGRIAGARLGNLASAVKSVLQDAIRAGGTTLRDFTLVDGQPGYFQQHLKVYDRKDEPCDRCGALIRSAVIAQRATYYCVRCQT